jgi:hypothetical protein
VLMTDDSGKVLGFGTIIAIVVAYGLGLGTLLGLFGASLGLSAAVRGGLIGGSVGALATILVRRRRKALEQHRNR